MARVTVEDCLENVENRFKLVLTATRRARGLAMGSQDAQVEWENDKPTVVALREIAAGLVSDESMDEEARQLELRRLQAAEDEMQQEET